MAIARPPHCAGDGYHSAKPQLRWCGLLLLAPKLPAISIAVLALGLAGCARDPARGELSVAHHDLKPTHRQVRASVVRSPRRPRAYAETQPSAELRVHRPNPALLTAQPAPNCEFKNADLKAVDPDQWERLKTEFERQCYQDAEKAVRDRLGQLQASGTCEVERIPRPVR